MNKIVEIRPQPASNCNGIDTYCQSLRQLFINDSEIEFLPIVNYPQRRTSVFHEVYDYKEFFASLAATQPTHAHINGYTSLSVLQAFWAAHKLGCKIIYTAHWHPFEHLQHPLRGKLFFNLFVKPFVKRWADVVTTINGEDTVFFRKFHKNVVQIPHWYSTAVGEQEKNTQKKENMILFVGRVSDENKGVEHLYYLPEGKYEIHCVGVGDMQQRSDIIRHINIPNKELRELYARASLVVVPSKYEAFSYVTLEALMSGTPVLASQNVRIVDYLNKDMGCFVFNYQDFSGFVERVEQAIGATVNVAEIKTIFSPNRVRSLYRSVFMV